MIEEATAQDPGRARKEHRNALLHGLQERSKWGLPYALALGATLSAAAAITIVVTNFTDQNAILVQTLVFMVAPALSLLAVVASLRPRRLAWMLTLVATSGIIVAGAAHLTWYAMVDERLPQSANQIWSNLILWAILLLGFAAGMSVARRLRITSSVFAAVLGGVMSGAAIGAATVVGIFLPLFAPTVSLAALITVVVLHRRSRRKPGYAVIAH